MGMDDSLFPRNLDGRARPLEGFVVQVVELSRFSSTSAPLTGRVALSLWGRESVLLDLLARVLEHPDRFVVLACGGSRSNSPACTNQTYVL